VLINAYNKRQLPEFIESDLYRNSDKIPISRQRALSHINNPDCADDDTILWTAYDNGSLAGYVGILPGVCNIKGVDEKIYWLSCFWVAEPYRKQRLASALFLPLIREYRDKLFISNFNPELEKTYQGLRIFQPTVYKNGVRFYVRFCFSEIIVSRFPLLSFLKPVAKVVDNVLGWIFRAYPTDGATQSHPVSRAYSSDDSKSSDECEPIIESRHFDKEFQSLITSFRNREGYIKRDSVHFDWILNFPWILQGKPDEESRRYFFSSRSEQFEHCSLKFYENEDLLGYVLLKIRDKALTVSYVYADDRIIKNIAFYILKKTNKENLKMITIFDEKLADEVRKLRSGYLFSKEMKRPYIVTKKMDITSFLLQEGDGDGVFT